LRPVAFAAWLLTALAGFVLFATWVTGGGARARSRGSRFSPTLVYSHLGVAVFGLLAWIVHLVSGSSAAAWTAVAALVPLVTLGLVLLATWLDGRPAAAKVDPAARPAEQWFPSSVVVLHGVGAVLTIVLVVAATVAG
jgi:hypothetical protein